jgi:hypothetical protein
MVPKHFHRPLVDVVLQHVILQYVISLVQDGLYFHHHQHQLDVEHNSQPQLKINTNIKKRTFLPCQINSLST